MRIIKLVLAILFSIVIVSCGGGGGGATTTQTISGTAAKGVAIASATVTIKDINGNTKIGTTGTDGKYTIDVTGMTLPFILRVPAATGYLYSVATATGTANIHPFTDLIIRNWYTVKGLNVDTVFAGPAPLVIPSIAEINTIEAVVRNILSTWLANVGLTASTFNLITSPFIANGTGFDLVLDNTAVVINATTGNVTVTTTNPNTGLVSAMVTTTLSTLTTPDTTSPSDPTGLSALPATTTSIVLVWNASTDNVGVAGYNIYRDGIRINSSPYPAYVDTGLTSSSHCYQVEAFDGAGNVSAKAPTPAVCATPAAGVSQFNGTYIGSYSGTATIAGILTITVTNGVLTGTATEVGSANLTGTVSASGVVTMTTITISGCPGITAPFPGHITGTVMTGTYSNVAGGSCVAETGTWTATRQ